MSGPLAGLSVVEITKEISGPYAAKLLADLGADVTKIEPPGGDPLRHWGSGGLFEYLNAGKRIVALQDAPDLIARADVLVENLGPGELEALGVDLDSVVLVRISAFGQSGPWRDRPATFEAAAQRHWGYPAGGAEGSIWCSFVSRPWVVAAPRPRRASGFRLM